MAKNISPFSDIPALEETEPHPCLTKTMEADHCLHINGYRIECFDGDTTEVRIDGAPFDGTYIEAVQACGSRTRKTREYYD